MKPHIYACLFLGTVLSTTLGFSQEYSVSGFVEDGERQSIAFAHVMLVKAQDSSVVRGVSSDDKGFFILDKLASEVYLFRFSFMGYRDVYKSVLVDESIELGTIILHESSEELDQITIMVKMPTLKKEADRLIFNIENTALIEGTMFDVLKSTPGILVMENSIQVKNAKPAVYINDRKVYLDDEELVQLLKSASANSVKSIEVITNPSAKYDATSGAVINIVMSKNIATGYRGNIFANFIQEVFPRYETGMSHFFKNDKIDFFANYSFSHNKINRDQDDVINYLDGNNNITQIFESNTNRNTWSRTHNFNFNLDYNITQKSTLSLSSNMFIQPYFKYVINSNTEVLFPDQSLDYFLNANNVSNDDKYNLGFDLDFVHQFEKPEEKISLNAHFTTYDYNRNQNVNSNYFDSEGVLFNTANVKTDNDQNTEIYTVKFDYNLPIDDSSTFEMGAKGSKIKSGSKIKQFEIVSGIPNIDPNNTNAFDYDETIYAGYLNFSKDWNKLSFIAGLRAEQTDTKGFSVFDNVTNTRNYLEWFPSGSINYAFSDNISLYTNYKRSIQRPDYKDLNPFQFYLNDFTIVVGNPNLQPVIIEYAVLGTSLAKGKFTVEAFYKSLSNKILELPLQDNLNNTLTYTPLNLNRSVEFGIDFITYFHVLENWSVYFLTSFFNTNEKGNIQGSDFEKDQWSNYSTVSSDLTFLKDRSLKANFSLVYLSKNMEGFRELNDILFSNLSVSKTILKKKVTVSLTATDLFNTQEFNIKSRYLNQYNTSNIRHDTRTLKLGFRYNFGNTNLETNQRINSQDETERLHKK